MAMAARGIRAKAYGYCSKMIESQGKSLPKASQVSQVLTLVEHGVLLG